MTRWSRTSAALSTRRGGKQVPVVWVQHSDEQLARGSDEWRIVPELAPGDAEPLVEKHYGDAFEDTTLETVLSGLGVGRLVVAGAQTDECVRSTLHGALVRGYDATLVSDAHTTEDLTRMGGAAAGPGHRPHEPVLDLPQGAGSDGRDGRDQGRQLRQHVLNPPRRVDQAAGVRSPSARRQATATVASSSAVCTAR